MQEQRVRACVHGNAIRKLITLWANFKGEIVVEVAFGHIQVTTACDSLSIGIHTEVTLPHLRKKLTQP